MVPKGACIAHSLQIKDILSVTSSAAEHLGDKEETRLGFFECKHESYVNEHTSTL